MKFVEEFWGFSHSLFKVCFVENSFLRILSKNPRFPEDIPGPEVSTVSLGV